MALNFFKFLKPRTGFTEVVDIPCRELFEAAAEYRYRDLCFHACVEMVAKAMGRCEFRTFRRGEEIRERDYYLWNVEPNVNQNSTAFVYDVVSKLYRRNEALIISTRKRDGYDALVVADSWETPLKYPARMNEYKGVVVGEVEYDKTFRENEVLHLKLNHVDMKAVVDGLYESYYKMLNAALKNYTWQEGKHFKVHISQIAQGDSAEKAKFVETMQKIITEQIKPFLESDSAVLPEFDGYQYENMGSATTGGTQRNTRDVRALVEDVFDFTARAFGIPAVLVNGAVEGTADANRRFLTNCIDPLCDQLQEEITRKRYGYDAWKNGDYIIVDSSAIEHFDIFDNAASVEKLIGSGVFSVNDVLRSVNQPTIDEDWAARHWLTKNIGDIVGAEEKQ